jgi:hypothetical protein
VLSRELAQPPLQFVALDRGEAKLRHHNGDACVTQRRFESLDVDKTSADSLTRAEKTLDVGGSRYPSSAREAELRLRRRRTCWAAVPSDACGPSSGGDSKLRDPIWFPCACGNHASECGACYGDGRLAYPCLLQKNNRYLRTVIREGR